MGKVAFLFSGQGTQYSGMGRELYDGNPVSSEIFRMADKLRPGTSEQCFSGTDEILARTCNTQPCMFTMELAAAAALADAGVRPDALAGFSVGEIAALTFSGAVSFEAGFRLVCLRGELMQADAEKCDSAMAAVLKLDASAVERLCAEYKHVYPVNYNCPGQISVSGLRTELEDFIKRIKAAGGRAVPLRVRGGFHSPFMADAAQEFGKSLKSIEFGKPGVPLYSDCTGLPYGDDFAGLLSRQISSPVRWQDIVTNMTAGGIDTFIEIGPGRTLCGFIGKTVGGARAFNVEDCESLERAVRGVLEC